MPSTWTAERDRRLLLSLFAANLRSIKVDHKRIADLCGGTTKDGVEHRFRVLKKEAAELLKAFENGTAPPTAPAVIRKNTGTPKRSGSNSKTTTPRKKQKTNTEKKIEPLSPPLSVPPKDRNARAETITDNDDDNGGASVSGGSIAGGGVQQKQRAAMMREKKRKMMDEDDDDGDDSSAEDEGALDAARQLVWDSEEEDNIWL